MLRVCEVSRELGYLDGIQPFLSEDEFQSVPRKNLVVICTGSQGNPVPRWAECPAMITAMRRLRREIR